MQVAKINSQVYSNNGQNRKNQTLNNNQQNPSFGVTFVPKELTARFEKLVANVGGVSLEKIAEENTDSAKSIINDGNDIITLQ